MKPARSACEAERDAASGGAGFPAHPQERQLRSRIECALAAPSIYSDPIDPNDVAFGAGRIGAVRVGAQGGKSDEEQDGGDKPNRLAAPPSTVPCAFIHHSHQPVDRFL
jgi:hypothetical protein